MALIHDMDDGVDKPIKPHERSEGLGRFWTD